MKWSENDLSEYTSRPTQPHNHFQSEFELANKLNQLYKKSLKVNESFILASRWRFRRSFQKFN